MICILYLNIISNARMHMDMKIEKKKKVNKNNDPGKVLRLVATSCVTISYPIIFPHSVELGMCIHKTVSTLH